jgi:hypothetical protein
MQSSRSFQTETHWEVRGRREVVDYGEHLAHPVKTRQMREVVQPVVWPDRVLEAAQMVQQSQTSPVVSGAALNH